MHAEEEKRRKGGGHGLLLTFVLEGNKTEN